jgi:8-oxo-dGTP pyrophosphatase MutT (NUDIX family)
VTTSSASSQSALPPALEAMTLLVAAVIVHDRQAGKVVLIRRGPQAKFAPGSWDLPVGKSQPGEPVTATAVRELEEETGLITAAEDLTVAHIIHGSVGVEAPNGFLTVVFSTEQWSGQPANLEPDHHSEVTWVDTAAIPADFVPTTRTALASYLSGDVTVSAHGW